MKPDKESLDAALEAAEWFLRHESGALSGDEKAEFHGWLKASPLHVREYLAVARTSHHLLSAFKKYWASATDEHLSLADRLGLLPEDVGGRSSSAELAVLVERLGLATKHEKRGS